MAKTNYEDMSYQELVAEKQNITAQVEELRGIAKEIARLMEAKQGDQKLQAMADKLSPEDKAALKDKL